MRHINMVLATLFFAAFAKAQQTTVAPTSFVVCYGQVAPSALKGIDLAILESGHYAKKDVTKLKATGSKIIAYLSLTEVNTAHPMFKRIGPYCIQKNENWNSYYINIEKQEAQEIIINYAKELMKQGYDGLFFDNLDNTNQWGKLSKQKEALQSLMKTLRYHFKEATLIQNGGFHLAEHIQKTTDYLLVESVVTDYDFRNGSYKLRSYDGFAQRLALIESYQKTHDKPVFILEYNDGDSKDKLIKRRLEGVQASVFITRIDLQKIDRKG